MRSGTRLTFGLLGLVALSLALAAAGAPTCTPAPVDCAPAACGAQECGAGPDGCVCGVCGGAAACIGGVCVAAGGPGPEPRLATVTGGWPLALLPVGGGLVLATQREVVLAKRRAGDIAILGRVGFPSVHELRAVVATQGVLLASDGFVGYALDLTALPALATAPIEGLAFERALTADGIVYAISGTELRTLAVATGAPPVPLAALPIVDVTINPATSILGPVAVGARSFLLVVGHRPGELGIPRLVSVDVTDPAAPVRAGWPADLPDASWSSPRAALSDGTVYVARLDEVHAFVLDAEGTPRPTAHVAGAIEGWPLSVAARGDRVQVVGLRSDEDRATVRALERAADGTLSLGRSVDLPGLWAEPVVLSEADDALLLFDPRRGLVACDFPPEGGAVATPLWDPPALSPTQAVAVPPWLVSGTRSGVEIIDLSAPATPRLVSRIPGHYVRAVAAAPPSVCVVSDPTPDFVHPGPGLRVGLYDLSAPERPTALGATVVEDVDAGVIEGLAAAEDCCYLFTQEPDPEQPILVTLCLGSARRGLAETGRLPTPYLGSGAVRRDRALFAWGYGGWFAVDLRSPAQPGPVGFGEALGGGWYDLLPWRPEEGLYTLLSEARATLHAVDATDPFWPFRAHLTSPFEWDPDFLGMDGASVAYATFEAPQGEPWHVRVLDLRERLSPRELGPPVPLPPGHTLPVVVGDVLAVLSGSGGLAIYEPAR